MSTNVRVVLALMLCVICAGASAAEDAKPLPGVRLRVLCWNIHHAEGNDGKLDIQRIANVIKAADPDLVALQEIDRRTQRTMGMDQPAELARLTGLHPTFGKAIDYQGGEYGQLILSRQPPKSNEVIKLPGDATKEQRIAVVARIPVGENGRIVTFASTHFDHTRDSADRPAQAAHLSKLLGAEEGPTIVAGDLNAVPDSETLQHFRGWTDAAPNAGPTIPADKPSRRIDYVLLRPAERWRVIDAQVLDQPVASDHRPVLVTVELR